MDTNLVSDCLAVKRKGEGAFPFFLAPDPLSRAAMGWKRTGRQNISPWLRLFVHLDAVRALPRAYLMALWWWLRGKRLRARSQLTLLLGASPRAYELWMLGEEVLTCTDRIQPPLVALVDAGAGQGGVEDTLRSLSDEGVPALLIGTSNIPGIADAAGHIDWDAGPWVMPLVAGDRIAPGTASAYRGAMVETAARTEVRLFYADDDLLDAAGRRHAPHFKPDWNAELFRHFDYLSGACILQAAREDLEVLGRAGDWMSRLTARVKGEGRPVHLHQVLHHRRSRFQPRIPAVPELAEREWPSVTVIVPTRNRMDLLRTCLEGIAATDYPDMEVIVVDNDSDDPQTLAFLAALDPSRYRVLRHRGAFNYSAINNRAAREAKGHLLCLLNNDIEMITPSWLKVMAIQAQREDVGAVGARLLYPDGRIQHAGVVLGVGIGEGAAHAHRFLRPEEEGYFRRHMVPQFVSAVTAACLVVERERFFFAGGFDEKNFPVAFNDVDLCLRLNRRGWQSLYEPRAMLIHHESVSRGRDRDSVGAVRFAKELAALKKLWGTDKRADPFHHPQLSRMSEHFVVRL